MTTILDLNKPRHNSIQHVPEVFKLIIIHSQAFIIPFGVVAPSQFHVIQPLKGLCVCAVLPLSVPCSGNSSSKELFPCLGGQYLPLPSVSIFIRLGIPSPNSCNNTGMSLWSIFTSVQLCGWGQRCSEQSGVKRKCFLQPSFCLGSSKHLPNPGGGCRLARHSSGEFSV